MSWAFMVLAAISGISGYFLTDMFLIFLMFLCIMFSFTWRK